MWLYLQHPDVTTTIKYASLGLGVIASADLLRFSSSKFEAVYEGVLRWFMREEERVSPSTLSSARSYGLKLARLTLHRVKSMVRARACCSAVDDESDCRTNGSPQA